MFENEQLLLTKLFFNYFWSQCSGQNQLQLHAAFETMSNPCAGFGYERFNQAEETNLRVMENGSEQITFERHVKHSKDTLAICSLTRSVSRKWQQMQAGQRKGLVRVSESYRNAQRKIQGKGAANLNYSRLFDTLGSSQKILAQVRHQSFPPQIYVVVWGRSMKIDPIKKVGISCRKQAPFGIAILSSTDCCL